MREGWEYKKFEECINKMPKAKQVKANDYGSGSKYPIISQEDKLISGYYDDESFLFHIDKPLVVFGDHTRVLKYIDFDFVVGADGVKILSPKDNLNAKFLLYFLQWYKIPNLGYSRHYKLLKEIDVPLPPKSVQLEIVSELDQINELIRLKKEQLKDYDKLAQSIFYEMFGDPVENGKGWEVKRFSEVFNVTSSKRIYLQELVNEGVPFLKVSDIVSMVDGKEAVPKSFIKESLFDDLQSRGLVPRKGDLLITARGTLGKCYIMKETDRFYFQDGMVTWLQKKVELESLFVKYVFCDNSFRVYLNRNAKHTTVDYISIQHLGNMKIPLPPLPLQQEFSSRISQIERQKAEVSNAIADLETLLASRMQYWFE